MLRGRGGASLVERVEMAADNGRGMGGGVAPAKRTTSAAESRNLRTIMRKQ